MLWVHQAEDSLVSETDSDTDAGSSKLAFQGSTSELADRLEADLAQQIAEKEAEKLEQEDHLRQLDALWTRRRQPLVDGVERSRIEVDVLKRKLRLAQHSRNDMPPVPGPPALEFVEGTWFKMFGNLMVALNLVYMLFAHDLKDAHLYTLASVIDNAFLVWYVIELGLKTMYHHCNLFIGRPRVVCWNWLDLIIVVSGVIDQWVLPLICASSGGLATFLRLLRIFRLLRVLRLVKAFLLGDMGWCEQPPFEIFMAVVIGVNSITMWWELDFDWPIWPWVENAFLIIYTFELSVRIKHNGRRFFTNSSTIVWNMLDFIMVVGGVLDLWLMPGIELVEEAMGGGKKQDEVSGITDSALSLLKMMRILRVLRLVRLLRSIKPLYQLLVGVMDALMAMQWVMIMTLLVLYAAAITWTTLIGKGMLMPVTDEQKVYFGTVPSSLFSLFKLMNGDTSVVEPITKSLIGQLMFACFMVLANWAVLAILTSVVSDNMISASSRIAEEEQQRIKAHEAQVCGDRLKDVFQNFDKDGSGVISNSEWRALMDDPILGDEVLDATGCARVVLDDIVECLSVPGQLKTGRLAGTQEPIMSYMDFIKRLDDAPTPVDNRSLMHVTSELRGISDKLDKVTDELDSLKGLRELLKR